MIISSGCGILAVGVLIAAFLITILIEAWVMEGFGVSPPNSLFLSLMTVLPYVGLKLLNMGLNKWKPVEREKDKDGNIALVPVRHSLYFIPLSYLPNLWLIIMLIISAFILIYPYDPDAPKPEKYAPIEAPVYPPPADPGEGDGAE